MSDSALIGPVASPEMQVMSFNIRRRMRRLISRSPDRWDRRRHLVQRLLELEQPALLGVQEALPDQAGFVRHVLGEGYRSVGYGRQSNKRGEGCPLFYDRQRLTLLDWSQTALSDTPSVQASTTWGNRIPRIVVNAAFRDNETGVEFQALNTHFDHISRNSRIHSAEEILRLIALTGLPAVVTGDFNTDVDSIPHTTMTATGALVDSWQSADEKLTEEWGTFPDYHPPRLDRKRIDWIMATPTVDILKVGINTARFNGHWPSDHAPVQAVVRFA